MARKPMAIAKPTQAASNTSRFDQAATFASNTNAPHETVEAVEIAPVVAVAVMPVQKKEVVSKVDKKGEVFNAPLELKKQIRLFVASPDCTFKDKSEFIVQCIQDGLKKYKDIKIVNMNDFSKSGAYRETFYLPVQIEKEIKLFVAQYEDNGFKYKKDFFIQCILDGLKKYGK